ncbi:MAG: FAD-dependent oxidoreductase [Candidatus Eiseniibacteriota bacterium]
MNIGIIGAGISGLATAYLLHEEHAITVLEAADRIGGHTHTVDVEEPGGRRVPVDTGFIVFNRQNYPNFCRLLERLGVASRPSDMSFSVQCERTGDEYSGDSLNTLFARRANLLRPDHYRMLLDVRRFNRHARRTLALADPEIALGEFLERNGYSAAFRDRLIVPMGAALWSANPAELLRFPALNFLRFFENHGVLHGRRAPRWEVVEGGSSRYLEPLTRGFRDRIRVGARVTAVTRRGDGVDVRLAAGEALRFDCIVIAAHSDQALAMLTDPSPAEREILGAIPYQANRTVLHTDTGMLPRRRQTWSSWNYYLPREPRDRVAVSYDMNRLQRLRTERRYVVSLNREDVIDPEAVLRSMTYHHPVYTREAFRAQERLGALNGVRNTYYCGAYWGHGFHEDGVRSALEVARHFGLGLDGERAA